MQLLNRFNIRDSRFWLLTIAGLVTALNFSLIEYSSIYLLFWYGALAITWRRRDRLAFDSDLFSTSCGLLIISWLIFRGVVSDRNLDLIVRMYPIFSIVGIYLLASKINRLKQYWRELIIVGLTGIPWEHISSIFLSTSQISVLDAKISRLILWYFGFDVTQANNLVILPTGTIQIAGACSSFDLLGLMWQCCLVIYLYFAIRKSQLLLLWVYSSLIALVVNGLRLCLMALLVANQQQSAFDYWHGSAGAEIFSTIALLLLALVFWLLIIRNREVLREAQSITDNQ